ncbi:von Willebrand factor type A domain-containing protein [Dendryphion nanum]|uniref:von Willebrand factor type A domain-containing protein n=1 Tax=Dendryphion nanum TaxID=256645 RepID=A0A9P9IR56_9PLEO|nr:von Willebrand factor type A domain-containing protein [Dendryphion nanum]
MLFLTLFAFIAPLSNALIIPRATTQTCTDLRAQSNNGNRKIAIVIDSSGSMSSSDPRNLRLAAGKSVVDWLISKDEAAAGGKKQDLVTVIDFDDVAKLDYPLGDPGNASSSIDKISRSGGTFIAGGVKMAIQQLTADGTGGTKDRSGIVVFTDGQDSSQTLLIDQINKAASEGIRVSFGFLSPSAYQDVRVLGAIMKSGGRYLTISDAQGSNAFINGILINGLTKNDNPKGDSSTLLAGLDSSHYISGSETKTVTYLARDAEQLAFTVRSVDAGTLDVQIKAGSKVLNSANSVLYSRSLNVTAPGNGNIDIKVTSKGAKKDSIDMANLVLTLQFIVGVRSDLPPQNCTVGIGGGSNKTPIGKTVGPAVGTIGAVLMFGGLGYFLWKHFGNPFKPAASPHSPPTDPGLNKGTPEITTNEVPSTEKSPPQNWFKKMFQFPVHSAPTPPPLYALPPTQPPTQPQEPQSNENPDNPDYESGSEYEDAHDEGQETTDTIDPPYSDPHNPKKPRRHIHRVRIYGNNHHHHIAATHPCQTGSCPLVSKDHICDDPAHPCTCVDPKCKLNSRLHFCDERDAPVHRCVGPKEDPNCPLNDREYMEAKKEEHRALVAKYMAQDAAKSGLFAVGKYTIRTLGM